MLSALLLSIASANESAYRAELDKACVGSRVLSVVAHADDDLYFINPSIDEAIARGACVHTVVVTAGYVDDPNNDARQRGLQAAYALMLGESGLQWRHSERQLAGKIIEHWQANSTPRIELSFLELPAGAHDDLRSRARPNLYRVFADDAATETTGTPMQRYNESELIAVLRAIIESYDPERLLTLQATRAYPVRHSRPVGEGDHPDHVIVAKLTMLAAKDLPRLRHIIQHDDYPIQDRPANLSAEQAARKTAILHAYCLQDRRGCADPERLTPDCDARNDSHWGAAWLCRHYPSPVARPAPIKR
ncbi:PIG-L family deacetylase [Permianibacter aggregans]|nr:PIG-L family deacetylase [Permianibacter aggregans]